MKKINKKGFIFIKVLASVLLGFVNGFIGAGAGMLSVPILHKLFKVDKRKSHASSLLVVLPLSLLSGIIYLQKNNIALKNILFAGLGLFFGGGIGGLVFKKIPEKILKIVFGILMLFAGIIMVV